MHDQGIERNTTVDRYITFFCCVQRFGIFFINSIPRAQFDKFFPPMEYLELAKTNWRVAKNNLFSEVMVHTGAKFKVFEDIVQISCTYYAVHARVTPDINCFGVKK